MPLVFYISFYFKRLFKLLYIKFSIEKFIFDHSSCVLIFIDEYTYVINMLKTRLIHCKIFCLEEMLRRIPCLSAKYIFFSVIKKRITCLERKV